MSLETASERKRKRIVEHIISGFRSAREAIIFGNTVEGIVEEAIGPRKFRHQIGAPGSNIAITEDWVGPTVLKTMFLELDHQNMAVFIVECIQKTTKAHTEVHPQSALRIEHETVREKPQPQFIGK